MSQPWINNIPEVDWHGANGSQIGGPECASSRYTEARLSKASEEGFFSNIKKNTVNMIPNFSEDDEWPELFPAIFPRLFVNGSQGIGLTIANVWVPGNLGEFVDKVKQYLENDGNITFDNIYPDFPSGGVIINKNDLSTIYSTGKGKVILRGKVSIDKNSIFIHELPYQVYAEPLIDSIKTLIIKEELKGIKDIYNKSDKKRILIEIECEKSPNIILNDLFKMTDLQKTFNPNQYALVSKVPQLMTLRDYIKVYIEHNINCISKEYNYEIEKANKRLEIVNGLLQAILHIDEIIKLIKNSDSAEDANKNLISTYGFTDLQAKAITDMKLGRLAKLEGVSLNKEKAQLEENITNFLNILANINTEFLKRLENFNKKFGYTRKTEVIQISQSKEEKEIAYIEPEKCVVITTEANTIKRIPTASFRTQKRNGKGVKTQEDITSMILRCQNIDDLMIFSNFGKMYRLLVDNIPTGTNVSKGQSINSLVPMEPNEKTAVIYSIYRDTDAKYVFFTTKQGIVKKTSLDEYINTKKKNGIGAINLRKGDELASVTLIKDEHIALITKNGYVLKFNSNEVSATSRMTTGVKGINLTDGDEVIAALPIRNTNDSLALFSENGLGKKILSSEAVSQKRGGRGLMCYKVNNTTGPVRAAALIDDEDTVLLVGNTTSICLSAKDIPALGRTSSGNQMIKNGKVIAVSKI